MTTGLFRLHGALFRAACRAALSALVAILPACDKSPTGPTASDALTEHLETPGYDFHYARGDSVDPVRHEAFREWLIAELGITPSYRVQYNKYRSRAHMGQIAGNSMTNGFAEPARRTVHTLFAFDNHEVVHVYAFDWGDPVALFTEGIAVAHQTDPSVGDFVVKWNGVPIHDRARQFSMQGRLPALDQLAATADFRRMDQTVTYPTAGSFVRFLLDTRGRDAMRGLVARLTLDDSADRVRAEMLATYGIPLSDLERAWWAMLDGR